MAVDKAALLAIMAAAKDVRERAYAPYSGFKVGAAVLGGSGKKVYVGSNVENASYGLTICAERVAICRAISEGEQTISAVVIVGGDKAPPGRAGHACK
jgi:cytidine deaminase